MLANTISLDVPFEVLLQAAQKLSNEQKRALVWRIQSSTVNHLPTRDELIAELAALRQRRSFDQAESLRNRFASTKRDKPQVDDITDELRAIRTEWETELDEFFGNSESTTTTVRS